MSLSITTGLPRHGRSTIMRALAARIGCFALCLFAQCAWAQQKPQAQSGELDVTMQIIVDPDAKLPDEIVRKIPLPPREAGEQKSPGAGKKDSPPAADSAAKGQERAREARELGREMSENAREKAREAAEQREQARRADEHKPQPPPPVDRPSPPTPPGH